MSVDRWNVNPFSSSYQCEDGVFVLYSEFESRIRGLEAERDRLKEALRKGTSKWVIDTIDMLDAENNQLRARLERLVKSAKWAKAYLDGIEHKQNYPKKTFDNFLNEFELSLEAAQDAPVIGKAGEGKHGQD